MLKLHSKQRSRAIVAGAAALALTLGPLAARGDLVPGTGTPKSDCYVELDVAGAGSGLKNKVSCNDGDACDADGVPNNVCVFTVAVCTNQTNITGCSSTSLTGPPTVKIIPPTAGSLTPPDGTSTACGTPTTITVPLKVKGKKKKLLPGKVKIRVKGTSSSSKPKADNDTFILQCNPPTAGGAHCTTKNPQGGPDELDLSSTPTGTDLDNGWTGISHNFPTPPHSQVKLCLTGCDASTNPMCDVSTTPVGGTTINPFFGPPLPLIAQGVPVCVINRYQGPPTGMVNVQTGEVSDANPLAVNLFSDVHLTLNAQVCPRCKPPGGGTPAFGESGTCDGGPNLNKACTVESVLNVVQAQGPPLYALSKDCPPDPGQLAGTLDIQLRLTTGTSTLTGPLPCKTGQNNPNAAPLMDDNCGAGTCTAGSCTGNACVSHAPDGTCIDAKGGLSQACCSSQTNLPCFTTRGGGSITRTGKADPPAPVWPDTTYPKTSANGILVTTFCEAPTDKAVINNTSGLPGPGALILPGTETLIKLP